MIKLPKIEQIISLIGEYGSLLENYSQLVKSQGLDMELKFNPFKKYSF